MANTSGCMKAREGIIHTGWLSKEGATPLSHIFPSYRFVALLHHKIEYYEELVITLQPPKKVHEKAKPSTGFGLTMNEWNLVLHVETGSVAGAARGLQVGDVVSHLDGVCVKTTLDDALGSSNNQRDYEMTVLRPKGEVPLKGAEVVAVGRKHGGSAFQVVVSQQELKGPNGRQARGSYMFIAANRSKCDEWVTRITESARPDARSRAASQAGAGAEGLGGVERPIERSRW